MYAIVDVQLLFESGCYARLYDITHGIFFFGGGGRAFANVHAYTEVV